jgi:hypothetical protein
VWQFLHDIRWSGKARDGSLGSRFGSISRFALFFPCFVCCVHRRPRSSGVRTGPKSTASLTPNSWMLCLFWLINLSVGGITITNLSACHWSLPKFSISVMGWATILKDMANLFVVAKIVYMNTRSDPSAHSSPLEKWQPTRDLALCPHVDSYKRPIFSKLYFFVILLYL